MGRLIHTCKRLIPSWLADLLRPAYHFTLALAGAVRYAFPSRKLFVVGITGTKGKTSTAEIVNRIFEGAGYKTALLGTLRFKVGEKEERNMLKMTMPGRFFVQRFIHDAVTAGCTHVIIEMTSEGAKQFRQRFIDMDALIFTNLAPEHIESHGSFEKYKAAKLSIASTLAHSRKPKRIIVANKDDEAGKDFLAVDADVHIGYSLADAAPQSADEHGVSVTVDGTTISSKLPGEFNAYNMLAGVLLAKEIGIPLDNVAHSLQDLSLIRGRMQFIDKGQGFPVVVDYAHTPDSLEQAYRVFKNKQLVCILGNTGGGRDTWKRKVMGKIANDHCSSIILTNEDPYDEDPIEILRQMEEGIVDTPHEIILDRREAIGSALEVAARDPEKCAVLITGKGTDPYIMGPRGTKEPWDDATVVTEELTRLKRA